MKETSEEVLLIFQKSCDEHAKLFIPEPRQDQIIESLLNYYNKYYSMKILEECIHEFARSHQDPIIIYEFAMDSSKIREKILEREKSKKEFSTLVKQTEERMRLYDEL